MSFTQMNMSFTPYLLILAIAYVIIVLVAADQKMMADMLLVNN